MNPVLTEEQTMLVESVRRFLQDKSHIDARVQGNAADRSLLWRECVQMGWLQACVSERQSGLGLGTFEAALMAEEMGRKLLSVPVSQAMAIAAILATCSTADAGHEALLASWLQGEEYLAMMVGEGDRACAWAEYAADGCQALDLSWDQGVLRLARYETATPGYGMDPLIATARTIPGKPVWTVSVNCSKEVWRSFCLQRRVLILADLLGTAAKALEDAVAYARERDQFGKAIGVNQAIKHRLADNWMALDNAKLALHEACNALDNGRDAELAVLMAELLVIEAAAATTAQAIQTFGAMGFTWECPAHFYLKRVRHIAAVLKSKHEAAEILDKVWELA